MRLAEIEDKVTGTYVGVSFTDETNRRLVEYQVQHDIPNPSPADKFHTTILYSRKHVPWRAKTDLHVVVSPEHSELIVFESRDNGARCLVWKLESDFLTQRFELGMEMGATFDFEAYQPHITLSYDIGKFDETKLALPDFNVEIDHEFARPL